MSINEVVAELNSRIHTSPLGTFQYERAVRLGLSRPRSASFFSARSTKDDYAFHSGGHAELQFNIGFEPRPAGSRIFRYGLALSFQPSFSLPDPVATIAPRGRALNDEIDRHTTLFHGLKLWCHEKQFHAPRRVARIPVEWMRLNSFVFVGKEAPVPGGTVAPDVLMDVVMTFAKVRPIYERVESKAASIEGRAARICFNEAGWIRPSGPHGKRKEPKAFEHENGYGFEEWLFDTSKLLNGYHYGFVQAFNHTRSYGGRAFDVHFYTIDARTKAKSWVARVLDLKVLNLADAGNALREYKERSWFASMQHQVRAVGGIVDAVHSTDALSILNCRFRPENLQVFEPWTQLSGDIVRAFYYDTFTKLPAGFKLSIVPAETREHVWDSSVDLSKLGVARFSKSRISTRFAPVEAAEVELRHREWQRKLLPRLREEYGRSHVAMEAPVPGGKIDIQIIVGEQILLLEIKADNSPMAVVRQALGQLLEYAYSRTTGVSLVTLVAVGTPVLDEITGDFLNVLRSEFGLPIYYVRYDEGQNELIGLDQVIHDRGRS